MQDFTGNGRRLRARLLVTVTVAALFASTSPAMAGDQRDRRAAKQDLLRQLDSATGTPDSRRAGPARSLARAEARRDRVVLIARTDRTSRLETVASDARRHGATVRKTLPKLRALSIDVPAGRAADVAARLRRQAGVRDVEVAVPRHFGFDPDDSDFARQSSYLGAVSAPEAWDVQKGSAGVAIAVVDSGVDSTHPDLAGKVTATYNAVDGSADVADMLGHGTFVAGVAAASTNNATGVAGAGYDSSLLAVKVADGNGDVWVDDLAAGVMWAADHGARIVNLSLGSPVPSQLELDAISYAQAKGALVVAAAGNSGDAGNPVTYPAGYPQVVAVGATDAAGNRAAFSQYGSWVTVGAPGVGIVSTTPMAGSSLYAPGYDSGAGTSYAAPLVAGEAALLAAQAPAATAAQLRSAVTDSARGYAGLGLGAGQVDFRAALDHLPPATAPAVTAPAAGSTVAGVVTVSAASSAAMVRLRVDGAWIGAAAPVMEGNATTTWATWGAANGSHTLEAVDCSAYGDCAAGGATVTVTLANDAPAVTAPKAGQTVSGGFTSTATSPGGGVAFHIDGVRAGFDATAPYSLPYSASTLADGSHAVQAVQCDTSGTACGGPSSTTVSFTARSLHPSVSGIAPNPFSPNGDRRNDAARITVSLPDTEYVVLRVRNAAGTMVRGPVKLGWLGAGAHGWTWTGTNNTGTRQPDGTYTVVASTSKSVNGVAVYGQASRTVRIDTVAPSMSSISGSGYVYPYPDGYRDTFTPGVTLGESGRLTLTVRNSSGQVVRTLSAWKSAGRQSLTWNARNSSNVIVPTGTYRWAFRVQDSAGNIRSSASYSVTVSAKRLVSKTAALTVRGASAYAAGGSASCAGAYPSYSYFYPYGMWLANACDSYYDGAQLAAGFYRFTLPAAIQYKTLRLDVYGNSFYLPSKVRGAFYNYPGGTYDITSGVSVGSASNAWYSLGSVNAAGHYSSSRVVDASVFVPNEYPAPSDFDVSHVKLTVAYAVLQ